MIFLNVIVVTLCLAMIGINQRSKMRRVRVRPRDRR